jgi:hypothetical protein
MVRHYQVSWSDFQIAVWYPGRLLYRGVDPYDVVKFQHTFSTYGWMPPYAPNHLWLAVLFGGLPATSATAIWFCLNVAMFLGLATVAAVHTATRRINPAALSVGLAGLIMLSRPGRALITNGQVSALYCLGIYLAWSQAHRRPWLAGLGLAIALGKPPFGLPLLVLLLAYGAAPAVTRGLGIFLAMIAPIYSWLTVAEGSPLAVSRRIAEDARFSDLSSLDAPGARARIDGISLVARVLHAHLGGVAEVAGFLVVIVVAAIALAVAFRTRILATPALLVLSSAILLALVHQDHDLVLLAWPLASLASRGGARVVAFVRACALPVLLVCFVPARTAVRLLHLGSSVGPISSLTTVCLLLAFAGAGLAIFRESRQPSLEVHQTQLTHPSQHS